jgi:hypothetical protein
MWALPPRWPSSGRPHKFPATRWWAPSPPDISPEGLLIPNPRTGGSQPQHPESQALYPPPPQTHEVTMTMTTPQPVIHVAQLQSCGGSLKLYVIVHPSLVCLSVCLSVRPSFRLCIHLSACPEVGRKPKSMQRSKCSSVHLVLSSVVWLWRFRKYARCGRSPSAASSSWRPAFYTSLSTPATH